MAVSAAPRFDPGRIEAALERIFSAPVRVFGSGRTDAGVHARGQAASISIPRPFDPAELQRALNAMLPADIVVLDVSPAPDDFDPRRDARSRVYEYRVLNRKIASAFEYRYSWLVRDQIDLDSDEPCRAHLCRRARLRRLPLSRHRREDHGTPGDIERVDARRRRPALPHRGNSFLRHMVRAMVAAMVEVGRGKLTVEKIATILAGRNRQAAPANAPPGGLYLVEVRY